MQHRHQITQILVSSIISKFIVKTNQWPMKQHTNCINIPDTIRTTNHSIPQRSWSRTPISQVGGGGEDGMGPGWERGRRPRGKGGGGELTSGEGDGHVHGVRKVLWRLIRAAFIADSRTRGGGGTPCDAIRRRCGIAAIPKRTPMGTKGGTFIRSSKPFFRKSSLVWLKPRGRLGGMAMTATNGRCPVTSAGDRQSVATVKRPLLSSGHKNLGPGTRSWAA